MGLIHYRKEYVKINIVITGGAGFIGSHTAVEFLNAGYEIIIVDNYCNSSPKAIERVKEITGKDFKVYEVDMCDKDALEKVFIENPDIDSAIHFAGLKAVGESVQKPGLYYYNNLTSTLNLLDLMAKYNAKRIVFSSSATVYGAPKTVPIHEDFDLSATNPYGQTKLMIEKILKDFWISDNTWSISILRYFNPIGAHESGLIGEDPNGIPPIVSKEQFEKAQRIMKTRENNHIATTGYALASKIYCGECGSAMTGETARSRNGSTYAYYSCVGRKSHHRNGCGMPRIRKEWIEEKMTRIVNDVILTDEVIEQFVETYREVYEKQEEDPELTMWKIQLKETEKKIENIISAIEAGAYSSALQDRLRTLETDRDDLIIRIDEKSREEPPVTPEMVREFFVGLRKSAKTESKAQQTLVDVFLRRLWLFKPQKKDGPIRAVFEISTRGSSADPSTYESMLSVCSSELDTVEAIQSCSNHRIIASGVSLFLITVIC